MGTDWNHEPVRVTARMTEPVVYYGDGLHLDGPVSAGVFFQLPREEQDALPPISGPWAVDFDLPLARWEVESTALSTTDARLFVEPPEPCGPGMVRGRLWGWRASAVCAEWLNHSSRAIRKRSVAHEAVLWAKDRKLNQASGRFKPTNIALPARQARELVWYAVGDVEGLRAALFQVRNVGKLASLGPGRVAEWTVEPWPHDWSIERDGQLMRQMPGDHPTTTGYPSVGAIRTPYHHPSRRVPTVRPDFDALTPEPAPRAEEVA